MKMVDPKDTSTPDFIGGVPKRRGRPSTGKAKSGAERMRDMRRRDLKADSLSGMTRTGLLEMLAWSVSNDNLGTFDRVSSELRKRFSSQ